MSEDKLRYDILASEALQGLIRTVLQKIQKRGLPGEHHFYITFDTTAPGTILSKRLKEQYPEEMTIVLQYQFWDLIVYEDRFEVKLSFNNVPERLVIPYSAIKTFFDPSVQFGFSPNLFGPAFHREAQPGEMMPGSGDPQERPALPRPVAQAEQDLERKSEEPDAVASVVEKEEELSPQTAEVVELDLFRKK